MPKIAPDKPYGRSFRNNPRFLFFSPLAGEEAKTKVLRSNAFVFAGEGSLFAKNPIVIPINPRFISFCRHSGKIAFCRFAKCDFVRNPIWFLFCFFPRHARPRLREGRLRRNPLWFLLFFTHFSHNSLLRRTKNGLSLCFATIDISSFLLEFLPRMCMMAPAPFDIRT